MPYGLDQFDDVSSVLSKIGYCVWNVEYRRVGESDYQWENAFSENAGNGAVGRLLMGSPEEYPERYDYSSPIRNRDKNGSELIIHGVRDEYVPIEWSERYCEEFKKYNLDTIQIKLTGGGHMDFIDTSSEAFRIVVENLI